MADVTCNAKADCRAAISVPGELGARQGAHASHHDAESFLIVCNVVRRYILVPDLCSVRLGKK